MLAQRDRAASDGAVGEAFEDLYTRQSAKIYTYCCRLLGDGDEAADAAQEVFLRAYRAMIAGQSIMGDSGNGEAWLFRVASNYCLSHHRHRQVINWRPWEPVTHDPLLTAGESDLPEAAVLTAEDRAAEDPLVQAVLLALPGQFRAALILRECEEYSYQEIARALSITASAVKSLLWRARERFRAEYARRESQFVRKET